VSGAAALQLQLYPSLHFDGITAKIIDNATVGVLTGIGPGSPNRLLYTRQAPLNAQMSDFALLGPTTQCDWFAIGVGGQPPYQFEFRRDGVVVSQTDFYSVWGGTTDSFGLGVTVTDGVGRIAQTGRFILFDPNYSEYNCWGF
jgi:hypothetical protein